MDVTTVVLLILAAAVVVVLLYFVVRRGREVGRREGEAGPGSGAVPVSSRIERAAGALGGALWRAWGSGVDEGTWSLMEEALLAADVGLESATRIVAGVRSEKPGDADQARESLSRQLLSELGERDRALILEGAPSVILVVGVNGSGKTTTIAKLASRLGREGRKVVLAAADTFRAAAVDQLQHWGDRLGVDVVRGQEGGDPAAVAYDAIGSARARGADVVVVDTAGRLHDKRNLMAELEKIHRVAAGDRGEVDEVLLVLDATGGQNGIAQVRQFSEAIPVTGIVLTKLDGTARGGIVIAVEHELGVPVKMVGLGEGVDDLLPFDPQDFVSQLLGRS